MAITVTTDTIVKLIVRSGTNSDRVGIILSQGELGYATDTKRLFVGDGLTAGGNAVGIKNYGFVSPSNLVQSAATTVGLQGGDIISDGTTLYTYSSATGWVAASFNPNVQFDNQTIVYLNGTWQLNSSYLSGGSSYVGAISAVTSLSGSWNCSNLLCLPSNSTLANTMGNCTAYAQPLTLNPGQFVGNSNSNLGAINVCGCGGIQTNGALSDTFYIDGTPLQNQINDLTTVVAAATGDIADIGTTFYSETSFVYGADTNAGTTGITNLWQNVFANPGCMPLRVAVTAGDRARVVRVEGRLFCREIANATTNWARLATFPTLTPTTQDMTTWRGVNGSFPLLATPFTAYTPSTVPISVLDVASWEGHVDYSQGHDVNLCSYYTIPANTTVVFGLQTFIFAAGGKGNTAYFELNGWQTGAAADGQDAPRNVVGFTSNVNSFSNPTNLPAYNGYYAWGQPPRKVNNIYLYNGAPGSSTVYPQTQPGISNNSATAAFLDAVGSSNSTQNYYYSGVKNISFIRAVFIN